MQRLRRLPGPRILLRLARQGSVLFVVATAAVNVSNFIFHLIVSRILGPSDYGALGALLNITAVLAVPLGAVEVTVAQSVARKSPAGRTPPIKGLMARGMAAGFIALAAWLAATPLVDRFFHLRSPEATIVLGILLVPSIMYAVLEGVLIGQQRFRIAGAGQLTGAVVRLAAGTLFTAIGLGVTGGVAAGVFAAFTTFGIYLVALRDGIRPGRLSTRASETALSTVSLGGAALLTSIDAWLARHFLAPQPAGYFVAAATAGNIALFLPSAITLVYFPKIAATSGSGPEATKQLIRCASLVSILGFVTAGTMAALPALFVDVLFGANYGPASQSLGLLAGADALIGVASCFVYFQVARHSPVALLAWLACALCVLLAALFHGSTQVLGADILTATGAFALVITLWSAVTARMAGGSTASTNLPISPSQNGAPKPVESCEPTPSATEPNEQSNTNGV